MAKIGGTTNAGRPSKPPSGVGRWRWPLRPMPRPSSYPLQGANLDDRIHARLRGMILDGRIRPGERIQVEALASRLSASRGRVVTALKRLAREGAVDWLSRRGIYVRLLNKREKAALFRVRELLEGLAARLAAQRITAGEVTRLTAMFRGFSGEPTPDRLRRYVDCDRAFHRRLVAIACNEHLARAMDAINVTFFAYQEGLVRSPSETIPEHLAILRALGRRDARASEAAMRRHLRRSVEQLESEAAAEEKAPRSRPGT